MKKIFILIVAVAVFSCTNDKKENSQTVTSTSSAASGDAEKDTAAGTGSSTVTDKNSAAAADPKQNLVGQWKEHWGIGVETNVNYNDLYKITVDNGGKISINCINKKKYKIDQVLFDGHEISFRKQNKSYPLGRFYVYYKLKLHDDLRWMEGPITNSKKQKDYVKWGKVTDKN
ncbi:MAG: hypothetical protein EOP42_25655 [Sphingobacteriaceae bacterium]|nr:MAG: hypothetical protein EOP42_25655 [Sphingobacteriaceae bacterium]